MKKLISAATSLAMAASMASTVVPFATGAAATKSFEIRPFNGASTTVSADAIAADAVTVPVGIYLVEDTADTDSISVQMTVSSADGDPSAVSFASIKPATANYFSEATPFTGADGKTYNVTNLPGFSGAFSTTSRGDRFSLTGTQACADDVNYDPSKADPKITWKTDYAFASSTWIKGNDGYAWAGQASDSFPIMVVEVTFAKGAKAGTYSLDFCDYPSDSSNADIRSCMIESPSVDGRKMTTAKGNLVLGDSLKITVGDAGTPQPATQAPQPATQAPQPATQAPQPATQAPQPATQGGGDVVDIGKNPSSTPAATWELGEALDTFIVDTGHATGKPGETVLVSAYAQSGGIDVAQMVSRLNDRDLPTGFTVTGSGDGVSWAANEKDLSRQGEFDYIDCLEGGDPIKLNDSEPVVEYNVKIPTGIQNGKYEFSLSRFTVATDGKHAYEAKILPGYIEVTGGTVTPTPTQAQPTQAQPTPTNGGQQATNEQTPAATWEKGDNLDTFIVKSGSATGKPGETVLLSAYAESGGIDVAQMVSRLNDRDLPGGFAVVGTGDGVSWAAGEKDLSRQGEFDYIDCLEGGDPIKLNDAEPVVEYQVKIPGNATGGDYTYSLSRFTVATDGKHAYEAKIVPGVITVDAPTATDAPTPTEAQPTQAQPTQAQPTPTGGGSTLTPVYGDVNEDGKVNIADVVILSKWMNDASSYNLTEQGKLNADCCDEKKGAEINSNDADAIIQSIVSLVKLPTTKDQLKEF